MPWRSGVAAAAIAILCGPPADAADPAPLRVSVETPPGCPGTDAFEAQVRARTRRARFAQPEEEGRTVRVAIVSTERGSSGTLTMDAPDGPAVREVEGRTCGEVLSALALTTALAVDPDAVTAPAVTAPAPPPIVEETRPTADEGWRTVGGVGGTSLVAALPAPLWGLGASVGREPRAGLFGGVRLGLVYRTDVLDPGARHADFHLVAGVLEACPIGLGRAVRVMPCGAFEPGLLLARGRGLDNPRVTPSAWLSAGALLRVVWARRDGVGVEVDGGFTAPLFRPTFVRDEPRTRVARVGQVGVVAAARLIYRWP